MTTHFYMKVYHLRLKQTRLREEWHKNCQNKRSTITVYYARGWLSNVTTPLIVTSHDNTGGDKNEAFYWFNVDDFVNFHVSCNVWIFMTRNTLKQMVRKRHFWHVDNGQVLYLPCHSNFKNLSVVRQESSCVTSSKLVAQLNFNFQ